MNLTSDAALIEPHIGHKIDWIGTHPRNTQGIVSKVRQSALTARVYMSWCSNETWDNNEYEWTVYSDDWVCLTCAEDGEPVDSEPTFERYLAQELYELYAYSRGRSEEIARHVVKIMEELIKKED